MIRNEIMVILYQVTVLTWDLLCRQTMLTSGRGNVGVKSPRATHEWHHWRKPTMKTYQIFSESTLNRNPLPVPLVYVKFWFSLQAPSNTSIQDYVPETFDKTSLAIDEFFHLEKRLGTAWVSTLAKGLWSMVSCIIYNSYEFTRLTVHWYPRAPAVSLLV